MLGGHRRRLRARLRRVRAEAADRIRSGLTVVFVWDQAALTKSFQRYATKRIE